MATTSDKLRGLFAGRWRWALAALAVVAIGWAAVWFLGGGGIKPGLLAQRQETVPNRELGVVLFEQLPLRRVVVGSVQSRIPIRAASRVAARITKVDVHAGDRVHRNQLLVNLDASDLRAAVAQARGELAAAQAELTRTTADEKRFATLFARGSVTARERDAAKAAWRSARGKVAQARAEVAAAEAALGYATVRSPVAGVVEERLAEPGDMAMPGKPLVLLYDENALRVELQVPEELARRITVGMALAVSVDATGKVYSTKVSEIVPAADPASRSFLVRAPLPGGQGLRPGMFARASFAIGTETVLTIPRAAVQRVGQLDTVYVVKQGRVEARMVSLGRILGNRVEVLAGVRKGERVMLDPFARAVP